LYWEILFLVWGKKRKKKKTCIENLILLTS
jgi:hypothetical protein